MKQERGHLKNNFLIFRELNERIKHIVYEMKWGFRRKVATSLHCEQSVEGHIYLETKTETEWVRLVSNIYFGKRGRTKLNVDSL